MSPEVLIHEDDEGALLVRCPKCRELQPLSPNDSEYRIYDNGGVYPVWVCLSATRKCDYSGYIFLRNWKQYIE